MEIIENWQEWPFEDLVKLYEAVNWTHYSRNPEALQKAFKNSTSVALAVEDQRLLGLVRSLSDEVSIHYLQDLLVHPAHQRKGVGRHLLQWSLERFRKVRTHMLLTDDEEKQHLFYETLGYKNTKKLTKHKLNAYVKMRGVELL